MEKRSVRTFDQYTCIGDHDPPTRYIFIIIEFMCCKTNVNIGFILVVIIFFALSYFNITNLTYSHLHAGYQCKQNCSHSVQIKSSFDLFVLFFISLVLLRHDLSYLMTQMELRLLLFIFRITAIYEFYG